MVRVLRDEELPRRPATAAESGGPGCDDIADALRFARDSGFRRLHWTACAMGALCRALQGRPEEAGELLDELVRSWRTVPAQASGEWIPAAAYTAVFAGRAAATTVRSMLDDVTHRTPWAEAALRTVTAALADAAGDPARAGQLY